MSAFQSTKCSNVLKSDKYGKCTHAYTQTHSADIHTHTHTSLQTHSPAPMQIFTSPTWTDGRHFKSKNNKTGHSLFIYYLALYNTKVPFNTMCCHPFRMKKGEERLRQKNPKTME